MSRTTTLLEPAASLDLITVERVKPALDIKAASTEHDDFLAMAIRHASGRCDGYCDRVFIRQKYRDEFDSGSSYGYRRVAPNQWALELRQRPVDEVTVTLGTRTLVEGTDYRLDKKAGLIRLIGFGYYSGACEPGRNLLASIDYLGGYIAPPSTDPDSFLRDAAPVEDAVTRLVLAAFKAKGRDPLLKAQEQPNMGRREWWIGATPMSGGMPVEIAALLDDFALMSVG